jgi:integrase
MARTVKDKQIGSREARRKLRARGKPYWRTIDAGNVHVGYRKNRDGGKWCVRRYIGAGRYELQTLDGIADDTIDADGVAVLDFGQAVDKARTLFAEAATATAGKAYTVRQAMADYRADYIGRGGRGLGTVDSAIGSRINPALGDIEAAKLTTAQIKAWLRGIATGGRLARAKANGERKTAKATTDPDVIRQRRAAANRILTVLKAGLNHAWGEGKIGNDREWRRVKPFAKVDLAATRYLSADECGRLVNGAAKDFRALVQAALLTGCRFGELVALRCGDFDFDAGTLLVRTSKSGKPRHVILTNEGRQFFATVTAGKAASATAFLRANGKQWARTEQRRPMAAACEAARIDPPIGFHVLRHSHASFMASRGVPLQVIGEQLGHADGRMTKRYSHLAPSYVADTIRANFPTLGIVDKPKVARLRARR